MLTFRNKLNHTDPETIRKIAASTGFFDKSDVEVNYTLAKNVAFNFDENHEFLLAEFDGNVVAYACFGELNDARDGTYEIFWLSTHNTFRGCGIGRTLINKLVEELRSRGAMRLYLKTDSKAQYAPTRNFYESCGFTKQAVLKGYYDDSDDCCIYAMDLKHSYDDSNAEYQEAAE